METISNFAHLCNGAAIVYFLIQANNYYAQRKDSVVKKYLSYVLYFWFFLQAKDLIFVHDPFWYDDYISSIALCLDMSLVPMMTIFFLNCIRPQILTKLQRRLLLSGQVIFTLLYIIFPSSLLLDIFMIYTFCFGVFSVIWISKECKKKQEHIRENYSYYEGISPDWVLKSMWAFSVCLACWIIIFWEETWLGDSFFYLVSIAVFAYIRHLAMDKQEIDDYCGPKVEAASDEVKLELAGTPVVVPEEAPVVVPEEAPVVASEETPAVASEEIPAAAPEEAPVVASEEISALPEEEKSGTSEMEDLLAAAGDAHLVLLKKRLDEIMEQEKLYLNPHLNISELAQALGTNRTYLSGCINKLMGTTFYDYVNDLRFDYACSIIDASPTGEGAEKGDKAALSLREIAEMSGFNSISTFNRRFGSKMGMSPSQYRTRHL